MAELGTAKLVAKESSIRPCAFFASDYSYSTSLLVQNDRLNVIDFWGLFSGKRNRAAAQLFSSPRRYFLTQRSAPQSCALEVLDGSFVLFSRGERRECSKILSLPGLCIFLARI
jgi:hypothetical protein